MDIDHRSLQRIVSDGVKGPPSTDEKRRCIMPDCSTVLSRYNPSDDLCRVHTKPILNKRWRDR